MPKLSVAFSIVLSVLILASTLLSGCAPAAPAVKPGPSTPSTPYVPKPEILNIIGQPEWNPSKEGSLLCAANDPDGYPLTYTWTAEKGTIRGEGSKVMWTPPDTLGEYEISVAVANGKGGTAVFSKKIKVVAPQPEEPDRTIYLNLSLPSSNIVKTTGRVRVLSTPEIECVVQGRDPSELTYLWGASAGKLVAPGLEDGKAGRVGWIAPGQGGSYRIVVTVEDRAGNKASGEVNIEVLCCKDPDAVD